MIFLFLSIICSVSVGVLFKLARKNDNLDFFQMITWNYFFAANFAYWIYQPQFHFQKSGIPWFLFTGLMVLLPAIFIVQANSIKYTGIVRTDIAQRLSLIISLSAAYFIFKESFSTLKFTGIGIGLISIFLILYRKQEDASSDKWHYPVLVLAGFGAIDVLFKQVALFKSLSYTTSLFIIFCGSFVISFLFIISGIITGKRKFSIQNLYWGAGISFFNFGNILFYLKAHQILHQNPSTVFACMNFGVIILGGLIGIIFFQEKMSRFNYYGLLLALVAVLLITISRL